MITITAISIIIAITAFLKLQKDNFKNFYLKSHKKQSKKKPYSLKWNSHYRNFTLLILISINTYIPFFNPKNSTENTLIFISSIITISILYLETETKKFKKIIAAIPVTSVPTFFLSSIITTSIFSWNSDVSPEKVNTLIHYTSIIVSYQIFLPILIIFLFITLVSKIIYNLLIYTSSHYNLITKTKNSITRNIENIEKIITVFLVLILAGLSFKMVSKEKLDNRTIKIMTNYFFIENDNKCKNIGEKDLIYIYENESALVYNKNSKSKKISHSECTRSD